MIDIDGAPTPNRPLWVLVVLYFPVVSATKNIKVPQHPFFLLEPFVPALRAFSGSTPGSRRAVALDCAVGSSYSAVIADDVIVYKTAKGRGVLCQSQMSITSRLEQG